MVDLDTAGRFRIWKVGHVAAFWMKIEFPIMYDSLFGTPQTSLFLLSSACAYAARLKFHSVEKSRLLAYRCISHVRESISLGKTSLSKSMNNRAI